MRPYQYQKVWSHQLRLTALCKGAEETFFTSFLGLNGHCRPILSYYRSGSQGVKGQVMWHACGTVQSMSLGHVMHKILQCGSFFYLVSFFNFYCFFSWYTRVSKSLKWIWLPGGTKLARQLRTGKLYQTPLILWVLSLSLSLSFPFPSCPLSSCPSPFTLPLALQDQRYQVGKSQLIHLNRTYKALFQKVHSTMQNDILLIVTINWRGPSPVYDLACVFHVLSIIAAVMCG